MNIEALNKLLALEKPSQLFALAIEDLRVIRQNPLYHIDMDTWMDYPEDDKCHVCLAGSLMANRLGMVSDDMDVMFRGGKEFEKVIPLAHSLNSFRQGYISAACIGFYEAKGIERDNMPLTPSTVQMCDISSYDDDNDNFILDCLEVIEDLQEAGL